MAFRRAGEPLYKGGALTVERHCHVRGLVSPAPHWKRRGWQMLGAGGAGDCWSVEGGGAQHCPVQGRRPGCPDYPVMVRLDGARRR